MKPIKYLFIIFLLTVPAYAGNDIYNGLTGWWTFDSNDISGTTVTDKSGNSNTGTLNNSPSSTTGIMAQALSFVSASSQYMSAQTTPNPGSGPYTLSAWVNTSASEQGGIISKRDGTSFIQIDLSVGGLNPSCNLTSGNNVVITMVDTNVNVLCSNSTSAYLGDSKWHLITLVWGGGNSLTLYVDGQNVSLTNNTTIGTIGSITNTTPWEVGYDQAMYLNGSVDDARIYNRVLSASEVQTLYYNGISQHPEN